MGKFRKKPVVIDAFQWFVNGDHPDDYTSDVVDPDGTVYPAAFRRDNNWEGDVVRYFRRPEPEYTGHFAHDACGRVWDDHGWIDTLEGGHTVCPGDWIITGVQGEHYPCKDSVFVLTYEEVPSEDLSRMQ